MAFQPMPSVRSLLKSKLPYQTSTPGSQWLCALQQDTGRAHDWAGCIEDPLRIPPAALLKQGHRRLVFRMEEDVVKAFPLRGLRRWTGKQSYASQECCHLLKAAARGLPVPQCRAYGEAPSLGGLRWNAAVLEYLPGHTLRDAWLAHPGAIDIPATLDKLIPVAGMLYETGINHIDFGPHAIVMADDKPYVIDWQYASFLEEPDPYVFASQLGYFAWATATNRSWAEPRQMREWFAKLWERYRIPHRDRCREIFEQTMARRHSVKERLGAAEFFRASA